MGRTRTRLAAAAAAVVALVAPATPVAAAEGSPGADLRGGFSGYAFDARCAPLDEQMDAWWSSSPYAAVGIYLGGAVRSCGAEEQPHLDADWVADQVATGWRLLPIWVGPQAACSSYSTRIDATPGPGGPGSYPAAAQQGRDEAAAAVAAARTLGIGPGSTLWFDLEGGWDTTDGDCRRSALRFLSEWTEELRRLGYRSGVYSSISAGIAALDRADAVSPGSYTMPDSVWFAWQQEPVSQELHPAYPGDQDWVRRGSWAGDRVRQFELDLPEEHGGVELLIDRNAVEVAGGTRRPPAVKRCGGVRLDVPDGRTLRLGARGPLVETLQCLLRGPGQYAGRLDARFDRDVQRAVRRAQAAVGLPVTGRVTAPTWVALQAAGTAPVLKQGLASDAVRRLQRALSQATPADLPATGVFDATTGFWVSAYQEGLGLEVTGVADATTWATLQGGVLPPA